MNFDIDFINETVPSIIDNENLQQQFEQENKFTHGTDIGGLMVYTEAGRVVGVYDYENYVGWIV
jgi:hypothetical protein